MRKLWHEQAWNDYLYWQTQDRKTLKRINSLIRSIERGFEDNDIAIFGKPEKLKYSKEGLSSVRIDQKNRLVFKVEGDTLYIVSCQGHYE